MKEVQILVLLFISAFTKIASLVDTKTIKRCEAPFRFANLQVAQMDYAKEGRDMGIDESKLYLYIKSQYERDLSDQKLRISFMLEKKKLEQELEIKDLKLQNKDQLIDNLRRELELEWIEKLRAKGRLTRRGVFEYYLKLAGRELAAPEKKGLDVTSTCIEIGLLVKNQSPPNPAKYYATKVYNMIVTCGCTSDPDALRRSYEKLCLDEHGYSWSGHGVLLYSTGLDEFDKCVLSDICTNLKLTIQNTTAPHLVV